MNNEKFGIFTCKDNTTRYETLLENQRIENERSHKMNKSGKGILQLVLGIIALNVCAVPFLGIPFGIAGLVTSINGLVRNEKKAMTIIGLVFSCVCLFITSTILILDLLS